MGHMRTCPFWSADHTRSCESRDLPRHTALPDGHAIKVAAQASAYRANHATGERPTIPIRPGSRIHGPRKDGFQAIMAAATRREQKVAAPSRHQREPSRSWPQHGARDGSSSRQSKGVAATRRPPLASSMSRRQPRDGEIRSHRSAKVARRVRACSNRLLGRTRSAHRPGSDQVASTSTCGVRCLLAASSCAQCPCRFRTRIQTRVGFRGNPCVRVTRYAFVLSTHDVITDRDITQGENQRSHAHFSECSALVKSRHFGEQPTYHLRDRAELSTRSRRACRGGK